MSGIPTTAEITLLRTQPFRSKPYFVVEKGTSLFTGYVNDAAIAEGETEITYDGDVGEDDVLPGMTLFNKSLDEVGNEKGSARIKSINTGTKKIYLEPNSIRWEDDDELLVDGVFRIYRILPKIVAGVVYEDQDEEYSDQNDKDKREPVALMGCPRYAWTGEAINFYGWRSYSKSYDANGNRYGIASYDWDFDGGTIVSGAADDPGMPSSPISVKWNTAGERHVTLEVTDDNGNTHKAYRPVIVVDRPGEGENPPYEDFEIELLEGDWDSGDWRARITVYSDATPDDFPNNALGILFCEDWYGDTQQSIGGWYGQEDILLCAYIIEDSVRQDGETGDVSFEVASITNQLKELDVWPLNFKDVDGAPSGWHEFHNMTVEDVFWHVIEKHTTLKNIADVFIWSGVTGGKRLDFIDITEAPVYDQLDGQLLSAIYGHLVSSRYSSVHGNKNFNMLTEQQRVEVGHVVMTLEKQDRLDDLEIAGERHRDAVCQVDFIGFIYDSNGDPIEVYSLAPANQKNFGHVEKEDGILLSGSTIAGSQDEADELAGLYLAYQNIRFPSVTVKLGNYRIFDPAHQDLVGLKVETGDTLRGYDWYDSETGRSKEFIVRRINHEFDHEGGYMLTTLNIEASTWGPDGTAGDYPEQPPPDDPDDPPPVPPPPPPSEGRKVIIATLYQGVFVTEDILASPPTWTPLNDGLTGDALKCNHLILDPWDPTNRALLITEAGLYLNSSWSDGGSWTQLYSNNDLKTLLGLSTAYFIRIQATICQKNLIYALAGDETDMAQAIFVIVSDDGGVTWTKGDRVQHDYAAYSKTNVIIGRSHNPGYAARMGSLVVSSHDARKLWVSATGGLGANAGHFISESTDGGTTLTTIAYTTGTDGEKPAGLHVPYHNNADDQVMYAWLWGGFGNERKSVNGASSFSTINPPTEVRFRGMLAVHTWNQNLVRAVGEIGVQDSNGELTISEDGASTWGAGVDLGMPVWAVSGFPYNAELMYFGRAKNIFGDALGDYPDAVYDEPPALPVLKITEDMGSTITDKSGALRSTYNVKCIVAIVPNWLE